MTGPEVRAARLKSAARNRRAARWLRLLLLLDVGWITGQAVASGVSSAVSLIALALIAAATLFTHEIACEQVRIFDEAFRAMSRSADEAFIVMQAAADQAEAAHAALTAYRRAGH